MFEPTAGSILLDLTEGIRATLGPRLIGIYLYGSLATGGFEPDLSDIDLLAATDGDIDLADLQRLCEMHDDIAKRHPGWVDRVEVLYFSENGLRNYKRARASIAVISPGEPLHVREEGAGDDWLMNWHLVLNGGITLFGRDPSEFIAPSSTTEFIESLRRHVLEGEAWAQGARNLKAQSYVVFTLCRTIVAFRTGRHVSKRDAAAWVAVELPEWQSLVERAGMWRADAASENREDAASHAEMLRFFAFTRSMALTWKTD